MNDMAAEFKKVADAVEKLKDINKEIDAFKQAWGDPSRRMEVVSDIMYGVAETNACIRARRCSLVRYRDTHGNQLAKTMPTDSRDPEAGDKVSDETPLLKGNVDGCCPGQTGHHVLPGAMFKGCKSYKHQEAPVVCVEGVNNSHGSHGLVHGAMASRLKEFEAQGRFIKGDRIPKEDAYDMGVRSLQKVFPYCDQECLKAQLRAFYDKLDCQPKAHDGRAGQAKDK